MKKNPMKMAQSTFQFIAPLITVTFHMIEILKETILTYTLIKTTVVT